MADPVTVMLVLTIVTGAGKQDIVHRTEMPDLQTCLDDAKEFLQSKIPDSVDAKKLGAGCLVQVPEPKDEGDPS